MFVSNLPFSMEEDRVKSVFSKVQRMVGVGVGGGCSCWVCWCGRCVFMVGVLVWEVCVHGGCGGCSGCCMLGASHLPWQFIPDAVWRGEAGPHGHVQ